MNLQSREISIHAPRTGSDRRLGAVLVLVTQFQSTLPARGATPENRRTQHEYHISIHAPRTGSDYASRIISLIRADFNPRSPHGERRQKSQPQLGFLYFNPRSPHGERRALCPFARHSWKFQSTLPARGATVSLHPSGKVHLFQSTLPARGATRPNQTQIANTKTFQSTLPARGAT